MHLDRALCRYRTVVSNIEGGRRKKKSQANVLATAVLGVVKATPQSARQACQQIDVAIEACGLDGGGDGSMCEETLYQLLVSIRAGLQNGAFSHNE